MRFGKTLKASIYLPWKDQYFEYAKLKGLLREDGPEDKNVPWTEDDESRFCEEVLNVQLEKVATFQETTLKQLEQRATAAGEKIRSLNTKADNEKGDIISRFKEVEKGLESITNETKELKKYSSINYTAAIKIVKKHDRKRGNRYKIRPMLQIALSKRPFNSEQAYAPLLNRLSMMYFIIQQNFEENADPYPSMSDAPVPSQNGETYTAYKCKSYLVCNAQQALKVASSRGHSVLVLCSRGLILKVYSWY
jgi:SPX domain protein involved in polyphosphate accumulation